MRRRQEETAFHVPFLRLSFGDLFSLLPTCQEKRLVVVYNLVSAGARSLFLPVLSELAWRRKAHFRFRLSYPPTNQEQALACQLARWADQCHCSPVACAPKRCSKQFPARVILLLLQLALPG